MNDQLLENSIEAGHMFFNGELSEDEVYSLCYQGLVDRDLVLETLEYLVNKSDKLEEGHVKSFLSGSLGGTSASALSPYATGLAGVAHPAALMGIAPTLGAGAAIGAATAVNSHLIHHSHLKEIAHKLRKAGVKSEVLEKLNHPISRYAHSGHEKNFHRRLKNVGRTFAKGANAISTLGIKNLADHIARREDLKNLKNQLLGAGVKNHHLDKIKEFKHL